MQSELLSHISAIFSGKGLRRMEAMITRTETPDIPGKKVLFAERLKERFLPRSASLDSLRPKNNKQNGRSGTRGINLMKIGNMDWKFNFKAMNAREKPPPPLPTRHLSLAEVDDLPPPLPERKLSLTCGLDEEFQGRFTFHLLSMAPLPEPFSYSRKIYPSQMLINQALQRPIHQPPPPPPPPADFATSPTSGEKALHLSPRPNLQHPRQIMMSGFTSSANSTSGTKPMTSGAPSMINGTKALLIGTNSLTDSSQQSLYNDVADDDIDLPPPPPPTRRLPPPPPSKLKPAMALPTSTSAIALVSTTDVKSAKLKGLPQLKLVSAPSAQPEMINSPNQLPSTPPFSPPPPPPPPLFTSPGISHTNAKHTPVNGSPKPHVLNGTSESLLPARPLQAMKKHKELPQLPAKPSQKSTSSLGSPLEDKTRQLQTPTNSISKAQGKTATLSKQKLAKQYRSSSPLPDKASVSSSTLSTSASSSPDVGSWTRRQNKSRPLPQIPPVTTGKPAVPAKASNGWGGVEVYDPREEEGDIYDVVDSTDM